MNRILLIGSEGYIGRALEPELNNWEVDLADIGWHKDSRNTEVRGAPLYRDFNDIKGYSIQKYDYIVLLAGHSSVPMCKEDMKSALNNNVRNFWNLLDKLGANQPLIYVSSGSVYGSGEGQFFEHSPLPPATNWYDHTKQEIDRIALLSGKKIYGLRFGTVNGASPNLRTELMLNSMYLSAKNTGVVRYNNENSKRAILGMRDLISGIKSILYYIDEKGTKNYGIYNLASFNSTIGHMAKETAEIMQANLHKVPDTPTYNFALNCQKFQQVFDWTPRQKIKDILNDLALHHGKMEEDHRRIYTRDRMIKYE